MRALIALVASLTVFSGAVHGQSAVRAFDLPAQSAAAGIAAFARQADIQLLISEADARNRKTNELRGSFPIQEALKQLLDGTGLVAEATGTQTYTVVPALKPSAAGDAGTSLRLAQSEVEPADEKASESRSNAEEARKPQELVVTGSRLLRAASEGPVQVTTINREKLDQLGVNTLADVFRYLPQATSSPNEVNTFGGGQKIRLRGLNVGTTLVLIDGRRATTSALFGAQDGFDLNTIPLSAVERVEVVSDSASAVYGSDAISGVVNIFLKKGAQKPTADVYYGSADGGAAEKRASFSYGAEGERWRASIALDYFSRGTLKGSERDRSSNQDFRRFGGLDYRVAQSNPGNVCSTTGANLPGLSSSCAAVPVGSSGIGLTPADFAATAGQTNLVSAARYQGIVPQAERYSGFGSAEWDVTDNVSIFGEILYSDRHNEYLVSPATLSGVTVPASNPFNPFGVPVRVDYRFTGLGGQPNGADANGSRTVAGVRGEVKGWSWELSGLYFDETGSNYFVNGINAGSVAASLASTAPASSLNVFQDGPGGTAGLLQSLVGVPSLGDFSAQSYQGTAFARGPLFALPSGWVQAVVGVESRHEQVENSSATGGRSVWSGFTEFELPLVAQAALAQDLRLTFAARYEHFSDFGDETNPKVGIAWTLNPQLLLRGSYGTSFRAPPLFALYQARSSLTSTLNDPRRNLESVQFQTLRGGNLALEPEQGKGGSVGLVYSPQFLRNFQVGLTYWFIQQDQRVQIFNIGAVLANESLFPERVIRAAPTPADVAAGLPGKVLSIDTTQANFGGVDLSGVDAQIDAGFSTRRGRFDLSTSVTYMNKYQSSIAPGQPARNLANVANSADTVVRLKGTAALAWTQGPLQLSGTARYIGAYKDSLAFSTLPNGKTVPAQAFLDLQFALDVGALLAPMKNASGLSLKLGARNIFDKEPAFLQSAGSAGYDVSLHDLRGRFVYAAISKAF